MVPERENGIFQRWVEEAKHEVQDKGWKDAPVNALLLLCHDMSETRDRKLFNALRGPARWFVGVCAAGIVWLIIRDLFLSHPTV